MELPEIKAEIKADLTKSIETIAEQGSKGLSKLFFCIFGKKLTEVQRHKALIAVQTCRDAEDIFTGRTSYRDGQLINTPTLLASHVAYAEAKEIENVALTLKKACEHLIQVPQDCIADDPLDETWFMRWRKEASMTSFAELQDLLARLLVENIKQHDAISYRTLDAAKNLTKQDCLDFSLAVPFLIGENTIPFRLINGGEYPPGTYIENFMRLQEAGLIVSLSPLYAFGDKKILRGDKPHAGISAKNLIFLKENTDDLFRYTQMALTSVGKEILKAVEVPQMTEEQYRWIADTLSDCGRYPIGVYSHIDDVLYPPCLYGTYQGWK